MVKGVSINCAGPRTVSKQAVSLNVTLSAVSNVGGSTHVKPIYTHI